MTRKSARELVFKILYQIDIQNDFGDPNLDKYLKDIELGDQEDYVKGLLSSAIKNIIDIDELIDEVSTGWPLSRIAKIDLSIIRLAISEMKYLDIEIPTVVSINEAIELAKIYGTEKSAGFVNAVLAKCK